MPFGLDLIFVSAIVLNLLILSTSRLRHCTRLTAIQGALIGLLPLLLPTSALSLRVFAIAALSIGLRAVVFPILLMRAMRDAEVRREQRPYGGYSLSLVAGMLFLAFSFWLSSRLSLPKDAAWPEALPLAFFNLQTGLYSMMTRKKAVSQALGYLVMENGIYVFGTALALETPFLVEMGVLLDIFVFVLVMGILIVHISREFEHVDLDRMSELKDWEDEEEEAAAEEGDVL